MNLLKLGPLFLAISLGALGCYKHSFTTGSGGDTSSNARYSSWHHHFLLGIIGEKNVDVKSVCPSGNATIKDEVSFVNGLVGALVGIIYYPSTVEIYCDGKMATLTIPADAMRAIALDPETMLAVRAIAPGKAAELDDAVLRHETNVRAASVKNGATRF